MKTRKIQTLTVDGLIAKLKRVKREVGGNTEAYICDPCADGIGFEMKPISDAHIANGVCHVQIPCLFYGRKR